jgi:hypothetical protein
MANGSRKIYALGDEAVGLLLRQMTQFGGGPNTPGGDGTNARLAKLEAAIEHIHTDLGEVRKDIREIKSDAKTDFRILFGAIIFVALGIAGLMAKGFKWL